ncbi:MAG: cytochrome c biogenesis CcdA family protein [Leucobacter sp.]
MDVYQLVGDGQLLVASLIAIVAGLVSFLSPCVLPLVPGYLAYVSASASTVTPARPASRRAPRTVSAGGAPAHVAATQAPSSTSADGGTAPDQAAARAQEKQVRRRMVVGSLLFVAGFTVVFIAILSLAGSVGSWLVQWEDPITRIMGVLIIVMGLVFMGLFGGMQRTSRMKLKPRVGLAGAPLLGAVFAIGWTPCVGPTLAVIGTLALQGGTAGRGAWLALLYCVGLGLPFVLAALGFGWMTTATTFVKRHIRAVNLIGGGVLIVIGLMMVSGIWIRIMYSLQAVMSSFVPAI